jgi:hypothetical protein
MLRSGQSRTDSMSISTSPPGWESLLRDGYYDPE